MPGPKGQLISKAIYGVLDSPKKRTKNGRPKREVTLSLLWLLMEKVMILKESK